MDCSFNVVEIKSASLIFGNPATSKFGRGINIAEASHCWRNYSSLLTNKLTTLAFQTHMASDKHPSHPILEVSESRRKKKQQSEGEISRMVPFINKLFKNEKKGGGWEIEKNHIVLCLLRSRKPDPQNIYHWTKI